MDRTSKTFSVSLDLTIAEAVERAAKRDGLSAGLKIADIVELHFLDAGNGDLAEEYKEDRMLLRHLRDEAIEKLRKIRDEQGFSADITLKTFQACQSDPEWMQNYEKYIRGNPVMPGNPRKTNANQTIGSRIKSKLGARDVTDASGRNQRGRAPSGSVIQTYQLLRP